MSFGNIKSGITRIGEELFLRQRAAGLINRVRVDRFVPLPLFLRVPYRDEINGILAAEPQGPTSGIAGRVRMTAKCSVDTISGL